MEVWRGGGESRAKASPMTRRRASHPPPPLPPPSAAATRIGRAGSKQDGGRCAGTADWGEGVDGGGGGAGWALALAASPGAGGPTEEAMGRVGGGGGGEWLGRLRRGDGSGGSAVAGKKVGGPLGGAVVGGGTEGSKITGPRLRRHDNGASAAVARGSSFRRRLGCCGRCAARLRRRGRGRQGGLDPAPDRRVGDSESREGVTRPRWTAGTPQGRGQGGIVYDSLDIFSQVAANMNFTVQVFKWTVCPCQRRPPLGPRRVALQALLEINQIQ